MKKTFLLLLVAVGLISSASAATLTGDLTNGLIAYYGFNGNGVDAVGSNNFTSVSSGVSYGSDRFGNANSAIVLPSSTDFAYSSQNIGISGNQAFTVSVWLNQFVNVTGPGRNVVAFGNSSIAGGVNDLLVMPQDWNGGGVWAWQNYAGVQANDLGNPFVGNSHNLTYVYNGSVAASKIYIDGISATTDNRTYVTTDSLNIIDTPLHIGFWSYGSDVEYGFDGVSIDDLGIWNAALSSTQVAQLYALQSVPEPSTYALFGIGAVGMLIALRRRKTT